MLGPRALISSTPARRQGWSLSFPQPPTTHALAPSSTTPGLTPWLHFGFPYREYWLPYLEMQLYGKYIVQNPFWTPSLRKFRLAFS
jgi:hypothetical protein